MTHYGEVAVFWWDTPSRMTDEYARKLLAELKAQPRIITNDRLKRPNFPGDTGTPEQKIPDQRELDGRDWESCMTMGSSWGYKSWDTNWKSPETLIRNLCDIASKGGNYLLNVGPDSRGRIPQPSIDSLKTIGAWMKTNSEAIYATKASPFGTFEWGRCTQKPAGQDTLVYFHVFHWPANGELSVPGIPNPVLKATLLSTGAELRAVTRNGTVTFSLPTKAPDPIASVIKVTLKGGLAAGSHQPQQKMRTGELD
jgi:alpha-L-fucosidase